MHELVESAERLDHIANEILDSPAIGLDIETTGYDPEVKGSSSSPFRDDIRILSINTGKGIYVVDAYKTKTLEKVVSALGETKGVKIAQNAKMEQKWLLNKYDTELWPLFDTYRASALIHNGLELSHDLYSLYERELGIAPPTEDLGGSNWAESLTPQQIAYAASDVSYLHPLRDKLKIKLAKSGLNQVALIEFGAILPECAIELNGLPFDQESWLALAVQNEAKAKELMKQLVWELPNPKPQMMLLGFEPNINLNSPPQMLASLRKLNIRQQCPECRGKGATRDGERCPLCRGAKEVELQDTQEMTLAMYAAEHPVIRKLIDYRGYSRAVSSFGPEFLRWVDPSTGRVHTSFFPFTGAGRYASSKPNTQNIPRDEAFRRCFKAPADSYLVGGDWSNIEMRIIAELSQDPKLLEVFRKNLDAHRVTASALMEVAMEAVTSFQRQQAKPVNFGFCIAEGQLVLTDAGLVPIEEVKDWHLVWDGVEWVSHDGVVDMGIREVITFNGLTATPDHKVYTDAGQRVSFGDIASSLHFGRIAIGAIEGVPVRYDAFDREGGKARAQPTLRGGQLHGLQGSQVGPDGQHQAALDYELPLSARKVSGRKIDLPWGKIRRDDPEMLQGHARVLASVQGAGDLGTFRVEGGIHSLGFGDVSERRFQENGLRSDRQQRPLLERQPSLDNLLDKYPKQRILRRTYDLLNAGPRHRFTVENLIVSNCYGMMPPKMVLYAMSNYGVALTLAQSTEFRRKFFELYERLPAWHRKLLEEGERTGVSINKIGRIRYMTKDAHNEYLNTPVQSIGAEGLKKALRIMYFRLKKYSPWNGSIKMIHQVHDEIITQTPRDTEIAKVVEKELDGGMCEAMQPLLPSVPVTVGTGIGESWADT